MSAGVCSSPISDTRLSLRCTAGVPLLPPGQIGWLKVLGISNSFNLDYIFVGVRVQLKQIRVNAHIVSSP